MNSFPDVYSRGSPEYPDFTGFHIDFYLGARRGEKPKA
jgi:hypothetical protein